MTMPGFLRSAAFIGWHDFRQLLREREVLAWTFVMPLLFFWFIGTVTGGMAGAPDPDRPDALALRAPADAGFLLDELVTRLEGENFAVARPETDEQFRQYARRLTVPEPGESGAGFTDAVLAGEQVTVRFGRSGDGPGVQLDEVRVARAVYGLLADVVVAAADASGRGSSEAGGASSGESSEEDTAASAEGPATRITQADIRLVAEAPRSLTLVSRPAGERRLPPSGYEQSVPGILVFLILIMSLTGGSIQLVMEREQGLLRRLAATPISRGAIVLGKLSTRVALGLLQAVVGVLAGTYLFGLSWGQAPWMIALLLAAWTLFTATLGLVLGNLARSEAQMNGIGNVVGMALAALGGCWWPIEITPDWMQSLAMLLPTGWAMDALHRMISFGYGGAAALPHLAAILTASAVLGWAGARTFRFQ